MDGQTLASKVIDDVQAAKAAAARELIVDEVHRPAFIRPLRRRDNPGHGGQLAAVLTPQGEAFLAVEALGAQHVVEDGRAPTWLERRPMAQTFAQGRVVAALRLVLQGRTVPTGEAADTAGGEPKAGDDFVHDGAAHFGL